MSRGLALAAAALVASLASGCADAPPAGDGPVVLTVSAAASLKEALEAVAALYESAHPGVRLRLNFAASGTLHQQVRRGAPVDVFISAAPRPMDELEAVGDILTDTRRDVAGNELVLVVPAGAASPVEGFEDLADPGVERVAIGAPESVPAGRYAEEVLRALGVAGPVLAKAVRAQHVRQVLGYVELGEVAAAVVYRTDAAASEGVRVVAAAPPGSHAPIVYPAAVVAATRHPAEARSFVAHLLSPAAQEVFRRLGFRPPDG